MNIEFIIMQIVCTIHSRLLRRTDARVGVSQTANKNRIFDE